MSKTPILESIATAANLMRKIKLLLHLTKNAMMKREEEHIVFQGRRLQCLILLRVV